jgi:hypothetical protein
MLGALWISGEDIGVFDTQSFGQCSAVFGISF